VRELKNAMERIMVLCDRQIIGPEDLGLEDGFRSLPMGNSRRLGTLQEIVGQVERRAIVHALGQAGGRKAGAARLLNISRPTLDKKIREYNVELDQ
jgi:DNA-binding NtrC family response regulator